MAHPQSSTAASSPQADKGLWSADDIVGMYRRLGEFGPVYEVIEAVSSDVLRICLVDSGRTELYPFAEAAKDPNA